MTGNTVHYTDYDEDESLDQEPVEDELTTTDYTDFGEVQERERRLQMEAEIEAYRLKQEESDGLLEED